MVSRTVFILFERFLKGFGDPQANSATLFLPGEASADTRPLAVFTTICHHLPPSGPSTSRRPEPEEPKVAPPAHRVVLSEGQSRMEVDPRPRSPRGRDVGKVVTGEAGADPSAVSLEPEPSCARSAEAASWSKIRLLFVSGHARDIWSRCWALSATWNEGKSLQGKIVLRELFGDNVGTPCRRYRLHHAPT